MSEPARKTKARVLLAVVGTAAIKLAACTPQQQYPPGNLMAPQCPGGEPYPCKVPDAGSPDGGK